MRWGTKRSRQLRAPAAMLAVRLLAGMSVTAHAADAPPFNYKGALENCHEAVCVSGSHLEGTPTHLTWQEVTIAYKARATVVKADLAEGTITGNDSKNSNWVMTGRVQIFMPQGHLSADRATMQIVNDRITILTSQGAPASFERDAEGSAAPSSAAQAALEHAQGHAREIVFDVDRNELELKGEAYVTAGCYEFSSEHMVYDIGTQRIQADPRDNSTVSGVFHKSAGCGQGGDKS